MSLNLGLTKEDKKGSSCNCEKQRVVKSKMDLFGPLLLLHLTFPTRPRVALCKLAKQIIEIKVKRPGLLSALVVSVRNFRQNISCKIRRRLLIFKIFAESLLFSLGKWSLDSLELSKVLYLISHRGERSRAFVVRDLHFNNGSALERLGDLFFIFPNLCWS